MDQDDFRLIVGRQVRQLRKAQHFSQERLAELAELHHTYISNVERGKVNASAHGLYCIAQALGVKLAELFSGVDAGSSSDFANDLIAIEGKLRQMDSGQRELYLAAIKGMLAR